MVQYLYHMQLQRGQSFENPLKHIILIGSMYLLVQMVHVVYQYNSMKYKKINLKK
jgi:hypothetical protein